MICSALVCHSFNGIAALGSNSEVWEVGLHVIDLLCAAHRDWGHLWLMYEVMKGLVGGVVCTCEVKVYQLGSVA